MIGIKVILMILTLKPLFLNEPKSYQQLWALIKLISEPFKKSLYYY